MLTIAVAAATFAAATAATDWRCERIHSLAGEDSQTIRVPAAAERGLAVYVEQSGSNIVLEEGGRVADLPYHYFGPEMLALEHDPQVDREIIVRGLALTSGKDVSVCSKQFDLSQSQSRAAFEYWQTMADAHVSEQRNEPDELLKRLDDTRTYRDESGPSWSDALSAYLSAYVKGWHARWRPALDDLTGAEQALKADKSSLRSVFETYRAQILLELRPTDQPDLTASNLESSAAILRGLADSLDSPAMQSWVLNTLGVVEFYRHSEEAAKAYYLEALRLARAAGDQGLAGLIAYNLAVLVAENHPGLAIAALSDIDFETVPTDYRALLYYELGAAQLRSGHLLQAVASLERSTLQPQSDEAAIRSLNQLASLYDRAGYPDRARIYLDRSIARNQLDDSSLKAQTLAIEARLQVRAGEAHRALKLTDRAIGLAGSETYRFRLRLMKSQIALSGGEFDIARAALQEARGHTREDSASQLELSALQYDLSRLEQDQTDLQDHDLEQPMGDVLRASGANRVSDWYRAKAHWLLAQDRFEEAAGLAEAGLTLLMTDNRFQRTWGIARATELQESLGQILVEAAGHEPESELSKEQLHLLQQSSSSILVGDRPTGRNRDVAGQYATLIADSMRDGDSESVLTRVEDTRRKLSILLANTGSRDEPADEIHEFDVGFLEGTRRLYGVRRNGPRYELVALATGSQLRGSRISPEDKPQIRALFKSRPRDVLRIFAPGRNIRLPLAEIAPDLAFVFVGPRRDRAPIVASLDRTILLGNPSLAGEFKQYPPIPGTAAEVSAIADTLAQQFTDVLESNGATKQEVIKRLDRATVLHLATHTQYNPEHPELSGLVLSPESSTQHAYDLWAATEIRQLEQSPSLVVLSACEGAAHSEAVRGANQSLADAFLAAGSRYVIANLWPAGDHATRELMTEFYRQLDGKTTHPSIALMRAQRRLRSLSYGAWSDPHHWAGWRVLGSP